MDTITLLVIGLIVLAIIIAFTFYYIKNEKRSIHALYEERIKILLEEKQKELEESIEKERMLFKKVSEPKIREDAIKRSNSVSKGFAYEHFAPFLQNQYHPSDFRHSGNPLDFVIYDGLTELSNGMIDEIRGIVFVDIKTGNARLSKSQKAIKNAVEKGKIKFEVLRLDTSGDENGS